MKAAEVGDSDAESCEGGKEGQAFRGKAQVLVGRSFPERSLLPRDIIRTPFFAQHDCIHQLQPIMPCRFYVCMCMYVHVCCSCDDAMNYAYDLQASAATGREWPCRLKARKERWQKPAREVIGKPHTPSEVLLYS